MRCSSLGALAMCLLLTACGPGDPPAAVPIDGSGGSGGGASAGAGGSVSGVTILSHNAGQDCMSCHKSGGSGKGIFTVAGTVYDNGGKPQIHATVMIYPQGSNTAQATMTVDGLGNFWTTQAVAALVPAAGQQFAQGAHAVVQPTGGTSRAMLGVITNGSCNSCHSSSGGVARVSAQLVDPQQGVSIAAAGGNGESLSAADTTPSIALAQIATGSAHGCVVKSDGAVLCWGANDMGQLGNGAGSGQATPVAVTALGQVTASVDDHSIAAGNNHTCVIAASGGLVLCWGANDKGQLGNGNTDPVPVSALALSGVNALSASGDETCARVGTGEQTSYYCWGTTPRRIDVGASDMPDALVSLLDAGSLVNGVAASAVAGLESTSFTQVATGANHSCGITTGNRIKCWEGTHASVDIPLQ